METDYPLHLISNRTPFTKMRNVHSADVAPMTEMLIQSLTSCYMNLISSDHHMTSFTLSTCWYFWKWILDLIRLDFLRTDGERWELMGKFHRKDNFSRPAHFSLPAGCQPFQTDANCWAVINGPLDEAELRAKETSQIYAKLTALMNYWSWTLLHRTKENLTHWLLVRN